MLTVYIPGVWDLLHIGHVRILERAYKVSEHGNLIVGVPSDSVVEQDKGEPPVIPQLQRLAMLEAIWCVGIARLYCTLDFLPHLNAFTPDILAVGDTWGNEERHKDAEAWCQLHKAQFTKLPYTSGVSTTLIKQTILNRKAISSERKIPTGP